MSVLSLVSDPEFQKLSSGDQQATLGTLDPAFHDLKPEDFSETVNALQKRALSRPDLVAPPQAAGPHVNMETAESHDLIVSPLSETAKARRAKVDQQDKGYQGMQGASEGAPLAEALGDWTEQGPIAVAKGGRDILRGDIAKGGHELISGGGKLIEPALPLIGVAAPAATARGLIGSEVGGYVAKKGAEALGATPDQSAFASDIGSVAGAGVGVKVNKLPTIGDVKSSLGSAKSSIGRILPAYEEPVSAATAKPLISQPSAAPAAESPKPSGMPKITQESPLAKYKTEPAAPKATPEPKLIGEPGGPTSILEKSRLTPAAEPKPTLVNEGRSPEDLSKVDRAVFQLSNKELRSLGNRFGLDESKYDFSKREATREGGTKHAVERDQFSKDLQAKLPADLVNHIVDAADAWDAKDTNVFDPASMNSKFGADRSQAIMQEALKRWQPPTEAEPLIKGGSKVKSVGDFSSLTKKLMKSLQIDPQKVLDELEGTDPQIQSRLLKASADDLNRWK